MSKDAVRNLTRRWVNSVLYHERDDKGGVKVRRRDPPETFATRRDMVRRRLEDRGWPPHRVEEKLRALFG